MPAPAAESSTTKFRRLARYIARVAGDPSMARRPNTMRKGGAKSAARRVPKKTLKVAGKKVAKKGAAKLAKKAAGPKKPKEPRLLPAARRDARKRAFDAKSDSAYDPKWVPPV